MHELELVKGLISEAEKKGAVKSVRLEVGDLAEVEAEELRELLAVKNWDVQIDRKKAEVSCGCGFAGEPEISARVHDIILFNCPNCGKIPKVVDGDKIVLKEVVV